jgi:hypothetical protein
MQLCTSTPEREILRTPERIPWFVATPDWGSAGAFMQTAEWRRGCSQVAAKVHSVVCEIEAEMSAEGRFATTSSGGAGHLAHPGSVPRAVGTRARPRRG